MPLNKETKLNQLKYINVYIHVFCIHSKNEVAVGVMFIIEKNEIGKPSSDFIRECVFFRSNALRKESIYR